MSDSLDRRRERSITIRPTVRTQLQDFAKKEGAYGATILRDQLLEFASGKLTLRIPESRSGLIAPRLTDDEWASVKERAKAQGQSVNDIAEAIAVRLTAAE